MRAIDAASQWRRRDHAASSGALIVGLLAMFALWPARAAPATRPVVYVAPIEGMIDLGLAPFVRRVLDEATAAGAAAVILDINTFGGRVDAAVLIRDALLARTSASSRSWGCACGACPRARSSPPASAR
jgi:membrane-bound ClpP family serine protease